MSVGMSNMERYRSECAPIVVSFDAGRFVATLACSACPGVDRWTAPKKPSVQTLIVKMQHRGWSNIRKAPLCSECATARNLANRAHQQELRDRRRAERQTPIILEGAKPMTATIVPMIANPAPATPATEQERSAAARKAHRDAIAALEIYFDDTAGTYREGKTDAIIAAEIGLAAPYITKTREQYFGPLKVPGEIAAIEARIDALQIEAAAAYAALSQTLTDRVAALRLELGALAAKNGWAK